MSLSSALLIRVPFLGEVVFMLQVFSTSPCSSRRAGISFEIWPWSLTPACSEISRLLGPTYIEGFTVSPEDCKPLVLNRTASITFHRENFVASLTRRINPSQTGVCFFGFLETVRIRSLQALQPPTSRVTRLATLARSPQRGLHRRLWSVGQLDGWGSPYPQPLGTDDDPQRNRGPRSGISFLSFVLTVDRAFPHDCQ